MATSRSCFCVVLNNLLYSNILCMVNSTSGGFVTFVCLFACLLLSRKVFTQDEFNTVYHLLPKHF